jgi:tRNA A37 threonylcarbamoyladenosine modification protein TsaB
LQIVGDLAIYAGYQHYGMFYGGITNLLSVTDARINLSYCQSQKYKNEIKVYTTQIFQNFSEKAQFFYTGKSDSIFDRTGP